MRSRTERFPIAGLLVACAALIALVRVDGAATPPAGRDRAAVADSRAPIVAAPADLRDDDDEDADAATPALPTALFTCALVLAPAALVVPRPRGTILNRPFTPAVFRGPPVSA